MKSAQNYAQVFILTLVAEMVTCNFIDLGPMVIVTFLPAMILSLPLSVSTVASMAIAFCCGLAVDFLADGLPGLNAFALVPVALLRMPLLRLHFGDEMESVKENFSFRGKDFMKISSIILIVQSLFLLLYIIADAAGTRGLGFNALRLLFSTLVCYPLSLLCLRILSR